MLKLFIYTCTLITQILCYTGHYYFIFLYHSYWDSPEFMTRLFSPPQLHKYLLNTDTWLFSVSLILIWYSCFLKYIGYRHTMCETKCHVELSATRSKVPYHIHVWWGPRLESKRATSKIHDATSKIPHLMDLMPFLILFNNIDTTYVMLSIYMLKALLLFPIYCVV